MISSRTGKWNKINIKNCYAKGNATLLIKKLNKSGQCWLKNFHNGEEYTLTTSLDKGEYWDLIRFKKDKYT